MSWCEVFDLLSVHILNVGHGDSIVLEHDHAGQKSFAVVDSNAKYGVTPRALQKLEELGAQSLSFVALTHPHADHYGGLEAILEQYQGRVGAIFTFPVDRSRERLEKLVSKYAESAKNSGSETVQSRAIQFIKFLKLAKEHPVWDAPTGLLGIVGVDGFDGLQVKQVLPPSRVKGRYFSEIDSGRLRAEDDSENELTLALVLEYKGHTILLGGDGTKANWAYQAARLGKGFGATVAKLPHHGSGIDCDSEVVDRIFENVDGEKIALISANGRTHPSKAVLTDLHKKGIRPYCTNLSKHCGGGKVAQMPPVTTLQPALGRFIASVADGDGSTIRKPCQGDVSVVIDDDGVRVRRQFENLCPYRNEYQAI